MPKRGRDTIGYMPYKRRKGRTYVRGRKYKKRYSNYRKKQSWYPNMYQMGTKYRGVYTDPFTKARFQPKIPDGKTLTSVGLRQVISEEVAITSAETLFLLFPGLDDVLVRYDANGYKCLRLNDKKVFVPNITTGPPLSIGLNQTNDSSIHRWRLVSQGLHISLINNAEENDGWFSAARIGCPSDAKEYLLASQTDGSDFSVFPHSFIEVAKENLERLPSYIEGSLRDVEKYVFNLRPDGNEHNFMKLRNDYKLDTAQELEDTVLDVETWAGGAVDVKQEFRNDNANAHQVVEHLTDQGWDMILIRVRGRIATDGSNSRLKMTTIANHEIIFDERSLNARFHTKSGKHPNWDNIQGNRDQTVAAAQVALDD